MYLGLYALGYDSALITGLQSMPTWNNYFGTPSGKRLGIIMASAALPQIFTSPFAGWIADRFGRKMGTWIGCIGIVAGAFIGCFAHNDGMLIAGRAVVGGFTPIVIVSTTCWINELLHPRMRGVAAALHATTYHIGTIVAAWVSFGFLYMNSEWSWRIPTLLQGAGPLLLLFAAFFCPESPRWLVSQGREDEAWMVFAKYHANGDKQDELVKGELEEVICSIRKEKEKSTSWMSLFNTPSNRKRLFIVTIIAYGTIGNGVLITTALLPLILRLVGVQDPLHIVAINGGLVVFNWLVGITSSLCVDRVGRRPLWLLSTGCMLVAFAIITALGAAFTHTPTKAIGFAFVAILFFYNGALSAGWIPLPFLYCTEILPYTIRAKAISYFWLIQNVSATASVFVYPIVLEAIGWKFYGFFIGCLAVYLCLIWFLFIETKGRTIEQVSALFNDAPVVVFEAGRDGNGSDTQEKTPYAEP
ncbi:hypothetical protein PQX77_000488 [Marasmius sp. AFHP31]|nr:hypothetical protein PQX77_000488 [Marasmius sp. AFHP31]